MHKLLHNKKLVIIVSLVLLVIISVGTAMILTAVSKKPVQPLTDVSAQQIVQSYRDAYTASNVQKNYTEQKDSFKNSALEYTSSTAPYTLGTVATNRVTYSKSTTETANAPATLVDTTESFLVSQGLTKSTSTTATGSSQILYDGTLSACQITTFDATTDKTVGDKPAAFALGCADKKSITAEYNNIDTLLALYKTKNSLPIVSHVSRSVVTNNDTPITVLYVSTTEAKTTSFTAYFVTVKDVPTYVGTQTFKLTDNKQTITQSAELIKALTDPTYGPFLSETIQKY